MSNKHPLNRVYSASDISLIIIFLIQEQSIWITAQDFSVDGRMLRVVK